MSRIHFIQILLNLNIRFPGTLCLSSYLQILAWNTRHFLYESVWLKKLSWILFNWKSESNSATCIQSNKRYVSCSVTGPCCRQIGEHIWNNQRISIRHEECNNEYWLQSQTVLLLYSHATTTKYQYVSLEIY